MHLLLLRGPVVVVGPLWASFRPAVTSGGRGRVSLAVVQIAIRSPCVASGQGCLLAVPQSIAEVDGEACRPRAESSEQSRGPTKQAEPWA